MRRALLVLVLAGACNPPDPLAAFKRAQRDACGCKDRPCADAAEAAVVAAIGGKHILPDGADALVAASDRCIYAVWAESHPMPALAETPPPSGTPCDDVVPRVVKALRCESLPLAQLDYLHRTLAEIQAALIATPPTPEMELYDRCVGASGAVLSSTLRARCP